MEYIGGIRKGATAALPEGPVLWGNLAHELLRRVLAAQPDTPEDAKTLAEALFDSEGPRLAGTLFLPGRDAERSRVRLTIAKAARALVRSLQAAGATELTMETEVVAQVPELAVTSALSGTPDLVVGSPLALLDLKWSSESQFRDRLKAGTAHQLAVYAELLRQTRNSTPQIGYFVIQRGHMLTTEIEAFAGADERISGPSLQETWSGLVAACGRRQDELRDGRIEVAAPADPSRKNQDALADGVLVLQAKCKYCDYQALCGRLFGEGEEE